jgi:hypothetical protein
MPVMMAEVELVDGSGCISDESDFYGNNRLFSFCLLMLRQT